MRIFNRQIALLVVFIFIINSVIVSNPIIVNGAEDTQSYTNIMPYRTNTGDNVEKIVNACKIGNIDVSKVYYIDESSIFFFLNKNYSKISFGTGSRENLSYGSSLEVIGDGTLLKTIPKQIPNEGLINIDIDTSNISILQIRGVEKNASVVNPKGLKISNNIINLSSEGVYLDFVSNYGSNGDKEFLGTSYKDVFCFGGEEVKWLNNNKYKTLSFYTGCRDDAEYGGAIAVYGDKKLIYTVPRQYPIDGINKHDVDITGFDEILVKGIESYASVILPKFISEIKGVSQTFPTNIIASRYNKGVASEFDNFYGDYNDYDDGQVLVDLAKVALGEDTDGSFVSLPNESYIIFGFKQPIINQKGMPDIFIKETGQAGEEADVFVYKQDGSELYLGSVKEDRSIMSLDLDTINCNEPIIAVKIIGKDEGGGSPGFDVVELSGYTNNLINIEENKVAEGFTKIQNTANSKALITGLTDASVDMTKSMDYFERMSTNYESQISDPIDSATGAQTIVKQLLKQQGSIDFNLTLKYNSLLLNKGIVGIGWDHCYEGSLDIKDETITVNWGENNSYQFVKKDNIYVSKNKFLPYEIIQTEGTDYVLIKKDGRKFVFNSVGVLTKIKTKTNQCINLEYDEQGKLKRVIEPISNIFLTMEYNSDGLLKSVSDKIGRAVSFEYDKDWNLVSVTEPNGYKTTYEHNAKGQITAARDSKGIRLFRNTFDDYGRIIIQDDAKEGNSLTTLNYDEKSNSGKIITRVTNRNGKTKILVHDNHYRLVSLTDEIEQTIQYSYDDFGNKIKETNHKGIVTEYTYDSKGNVTSITDGLNRKTNFTFDKNSNLISILTPDKSNKRFSYDPNNNLIKAVDTLGNSIIYGYDTNGRLTSLVTSDGGKFSYEHEAGFLTKETDPTGVVTQYNYDGIGRIVTKVLPNGKSISFEYDKNDNLTRLINSDGVKQSFEYDATGNMLKSIDANGNITKYEYDKNGMPVKIIDSLENTTSYVYDGEDQLIKVIDPRGNETNFILDDKGRRTGIKDALGNLVSYNYDENDNLVSITNSRGEKILTNTYDEVGNIVKTEDALGRVIKSQYDSMNRIVSNMNPLGKATKFAYNKNGNLISSIDARNGKATQEFSKSGLVTKITDTKGYSTEFKYDAAGRLISHTNTSLKEIKNTYNSFGQLETFMNGRNKSSLFFYDDLGRLKSIKDEAGTIEYTYDANSNVTSITENGKIMAFKRDALNRITEYTDAMGNVIKYVYDKSGNLTELIYPDGKIVKYSYDSLNRLTEVIDWSERKTHYEYDSDSRLIKTIRPDGSILGNTFDVMGQLIKQSDVDKNGKAICSFEYTYDLNGNIKTEESSGLLQEQNKQAAVLVYGSGNQLQSYNDQKITYDEDGNITEGPLTQKTDEYSYDVRNRLVAAGGLTYEYNALDQRISV